MEARHKFKLHWYKYIDSVKLTNIIKPSSLIPQLERIVTNYQYYYKYFYYQQNQKIDPNFYCLTLVK